jgi:hypothetical protein
MQQGGGHMLAGKPPHSWLGGRKYSLICFDIHSIEANASIEYVDWGSSGCHSTSDGMGGSHRYNRSRSNLHGCCALLLAVTTLHGIGLAL